MIGSDDHGGGLYSGSGLAQGATAIPEKQATLYLAPSVTITETWRFPSYTCDDHLYCGSTETHDDDLLLSRRPVDRARCVPCSRAGSSKRLRPLTRSAGLKHAQASQASGVQCLNHICATLRTTIVGAHRRICADSRALCGHRLLQGTLVNIQPPFQPTLRQLDCRKITSRPIIPLTCRAPRTSLTALWVHGTSACFRATCYKSQVVQTGLMRRCAMLQQQQMRS
jgi:hypothetical protein